MLVKNKKGFSLFTPLIGTTIIVIAAILSAMMLQNDVRISRTLSESFEQTNQGNAAKLIKATSSIKLFNEIKKANDDFFTGGNGNYGIEKVSDSNSDHLKDIEYEYKRHLRNYLRTNAFFEIMEAITNETDYKGQELVCPINNQRISPSTCISNAIIKSNETIKLQQDGNNYDISFNPSSYDATINKEIQNSFVVTFRSNSNGDKMVLSIKPQDLVYETQNNAYDIFNNISTKYTKIISTNINNGFEDAIGDLGNYYNSIEVKGDSNNNFLVTFELKTGLNITLETEVSNNLTPYCKVDSSGKIGSHCSSQ